MSGQSTITRRSFVQTAALFSGGMFGMPLWAAMRYCKDTVLSRFREQAKDIDARVAAGIEQNRKSQASLFFEDAKGRPCETVHVRIRQKKHAFKYGANLFMLDEIPDSIEKNELYKERFAAAFNLATLPFYWKDLEPEEGKPRYRKNSPRLYRRPPPDLCLEWCEANGVEPKAHCLNYMADYAMPQWAKGTVAQEKARLERHFRELAERYSHRIPMWEVTNETLHWKADRLNTAAFFSMPDLVEWSFKTAERYFGANKLIINETQLYVWEEFKGTRSPYYMQIENAVLKGCRIDGIGFQAHSFWGTDMSQVEKKAVEQYDPRLIFDVLDTYEALGRPMQITEVTIPAYSNDPGDEAVQAEILRELYRIWFSHRGMEAIVYWNMPDGYATGARPGNFTAGENVYYGGLCRFDMSPKPAYDVILELFGREWRTDIDCDVSGGFFSFRGFHGDYEIEAVSNGAVVRRAFSICPNRQSAIKIVI